jgi:hypothetical protein
MHAAVHHRSNYSPKQNSDKSPVRSIRDTIVAYRKAVDESENGPGLWLSRDHPSKRWIAVDSNILMRDWKIKVDARCKLDHIYLSQKP